jgi:hypothetical protein
MNRGELNDDYLDNGRDKRVSTKTTRTDKNQWGFASDLLPVPNRMERCYHPHGEEPRVIG